MFRMGINRSLWTVDWPCNVKTSPIPFLDSPVRPNDGYTSRTERQCKVDVGHRLYPGRLQQLFGIGHAGFNMAFDRSGNINR